MSETDTTVPPARPRALRITSGCATRDAFVSFFRPFCQESSIFIATKTPKAAGDRVRVSLTLANGEALIVGTGHVAESYDTGGPFGRSGMRIQFEEMTPESRALLEEIGGRPSDATIKAPALVRDGVEEEHAPEAAPPAAAGAEAKAETEERTPGSALILPANPLSDLDPTSLDVFIDCTIVEDEGGFEGEATSPGAAGDKTVAEVARAAADREEPSFDVAAAPVPVPVLSGTETAPGFAPAAEPLPPRAPQPEPMLGLLPPIAPPRPGRGKAIALGFVAGALPAALIGFLIGRATADGDRNRPDRGADVPVAAPAPRAPAVDPPAVEPATPTGAAPGDGCAASITTEPPEAVVRAGDRELGKTPLDVIDLPCGPQTLSIRRPRYRDEEVAVELKPGQRVPVAVKLERPEFKVKISTDPRATIAMDGQTVGFSPVVVKVKGHTPIELSAEHAGYQKWSKKLKATKSTDLDVTLVPLKGTSPGGARPSPRPTGRPPK